MAEGGNSVDETDCDQVGAGLYEDDSNYDALESLKGLNAKLKLKQLQQSQGAKSRNRIPAKQSTQNTMVQDKKLGQPEPTEEHIAALDNLIEDTHKQHGLSREQMIHREILVHQLQEYLAQRIPDIQLRMYGSSLTGFGFHTSDLNIALVVEKECNPAHKLAKVYSVLKEADDYYDVRSNFLARVPDVVFKSPCGTVECRVTMRTETAYFTSRYLRIYADMDPRVTQLAVVLRHWAKICQVDVQENGYLPAYSYGLMAVYFLQQCRPPVLPAIWEDLSEEVLRRHKTKDIMDMLDRLEKETWTSESKATVGQLWQDLLLFYDRKIDPKKCIINIRALTPSPRTEKFNRKGIIIEDPFSSMRGGARFLLNTRVFDYFYNCLRKTRVHFSVPNSNSDRLGTAVIGEHEDSLMEALVMADRGASSSCESEDDLVEHTDESGSRYKNIIEAENSDSSPIRAKRLNKTSDDAEYKFTFRPETLADGKGPPIVCQICQKEGHLKSDCRDSVLPDIVDLPPVSSRHIALLNSTIEQVPKDLRMSQSEKRKREDIMRNLEAKVQAIFPDAEMCLFGSSANGFGFHGSDLDICVTFRDKGPEDVDVVGCIEEICKKLKSYQRLSDVYPITTAKVPIVKFKHRESYLEGDISLYGIIAQQNTKMLYTYSCIDQRVVSLVLAIKVFANVCDIGDASRGRLSSYAYTLMMLHYLQHTNPPVLPVLQELQTKDNPDPQIVIDGWNTWFFDDLENLPDVWPGAWKNKQNVGELWLGFFKYYLEEFSFLERVITIRQFEPLTKFEKLWNVRSNGWCIAIEDPFNLNHNLGGALSMKMNRYILQSFVCARKLYGTPLSKKPRKMSLADYFFDRARLTKGRPPSKGLCGRCDKIGHIAKDCPTKTRYRR